MKNMSVKIFAIITLLTIVVFSQNANPVVSDVDFSITGTTVTVTYNLSDTQQGTVMISMFVSSNNGATWDYNYETATGAIGPDISTGNNKSIVWTYSGELNENFKIRIIADDNTDGGSTCPGAATVDYGGQTYNTIQIGNQCWLRENLNVGTRINGSNNQTNNGTLEKYCYSDLESNCNTYGALYQWDESMQYVTTPGTKGICPEGWHIPTLAEFYTLMDFVGGSITGSNRLKATTQGSGFGVGLNTSGFSALLSGFRFFGIFAYLGNYTYFWSSLEYSSNNNNALYLFLRYDSGNLEMVNMDKVFGLSVRCLKD